MTYLATPEQQAILDAELVSLKVIACAGSGKTATAVRRLVEVRRRMGASRGYAVLLSYSNVAVETFRTQYTAVAAKYPGLSTRVHICTMDSFITNNILLPHAAQVMDCACRPFLVHGRERFLENPAYSVFDGKRPVAITSVDLRTTGPGLWEFINSDSKQVLPKPNAVKAVKALAKVGAYTHALGRFWVMVTLRKQARLCDILATRYPHILIDEAQDIGSLHGASLELLQKSGSVLAVVGDSNQAIYEFADADGSFLKGFALPAGGRQLPLTENRRSVSQIIAVANRIAAPVCKPIREAPARTHGSFYLKYEATKIQNLVSVFSQILRAHEYKTSEATILARGASLAYQLKGGKDAFGQGATRLFAEAAVSRDVRGDIATAFERTLDATFRLVEVGDAILRAKVVSGERGDGAQNLRRLIWGFLRNRVAGVPASTLSGDQWHAQLKARLPAFLATLSTECGLATRKSWAMNVTAKEISAAPLFEEDLAVGEGQDIRVSTVHKVKGESIPAVLYVTNSKSLNSLLGGTGDEEGRIGYVAITRAADLLILAVPKTIDKAKVTALEQRGFIEWKA
ncbi:UvrD-helicase domain-containing protein [Polaromonas sp. CT11-55]|uniref:UvrD-helicase domain-containing protein n=1 Tax=Polaromonas sp. CT11-55 TaxID=3243045 RepID=UPI0039A692C0